MSAPGEWAALQARIAGEQNPERPAPPGMAGANGRPESSPAEREKAMDEQHVQKVIDEFIGRAIEAMEPPRDVDWFAILEFECHRASGALIGHSRRST